MKRVFSLLALLLLPAACAQPITDLLLHPENFDNHIITVRGEVLGILKRGGKVWVNIENGEAIGVWCEAWMVENIKVIADYHHRGDIIQVTGVFHKACLEHGGDPDIHAENLEIVEVGYEIPREVNWWFMGLSILSLALSVYVSVRLRKRAGKRAPPYWY
jgi:hypothetical protein